MKKIVTASLITTGVMISSSKPCDQFEYVKLNTAAMDKSTIEESMKDVHEISMEERAKVFNHYYKKLILPYEGGVSRDQNDSQAKCAKKGKAHTNRGLGICTAKGLFKHRPNRYSFLDKDSNEKIDHRDVVKWTKEDVRKVAYYEFWRYTGSHRINDPRIAALLCDWGWGSGPGTATKRVRHVLKTSFNKDVEVSAKRMKDHEIKMINRLDADKLLQALIKTRVYDLKRISEIRNNHQYLDNWLDRLYSISTKMDVDQIRS